MVFQLPEGKNFRTDKWGVAYIFHASGHRARGNPQSWMVNSTIRLNTYNEWVAERASAFVRARFQIGGDAWKRRYWIELDAWEALTLVLDGTLQSKDFDTAQEDEESITLKNASVDGLLRDLTIIPWRCNLQTMMLSQVGNH
jgi:hypothetical protein